MKSININQRLADKIISVLLLLLCALILWEIRNFSEYGRYFPYIVTLFLLMFSLVYFIKSWAAPLRKMESLGKEQHELIEDLSSFLISFGGVLVYVFVLFSLLGFLAGSILFCISVIIGVQITRAEANLKSVISSFVVSSVFSFMMYYLFRHLFHIRLP